VSTLVVPNVLRVQPNFASLMEEGGAVRFLDVTRVPETSFFVLRKCFCVLCASFDTSVILVFSFYSFRYVLPHTCVFLIMLFEKARWWQAMYL
jgi:hypothetical protein